MTMHAGSPQQAAPTSTSRRHPPPSLHSESSSPRNRGRRPLAGPVTHSEILWSDQRRRATRGGHRSDRTRRRQPLPRGSHGARTVRVSESGTRLHHRVGGSTSGAQPPGTSDPRTLARDLRVRANLSADTVVTSPFESRSADIGRYMPRGPLPPHVRVDEL